MSPAGRPPSPRGTEGVALTVRLAKDERDLLERAGQHAGSRSAADYARTTALAAARRALGEEDDERRPLRASFWVRCNVCSKVISDPGRSLTMLSRPAPCCGGTGMRTVWPSSARLELRSLAQLNLHNTAADDATAPDDAARVRVAALFLSAACEALLSEVLWAMFARFQLPRSVAVALDARAGERDGKLALYKELASVSSREVLTAANAVAWHDAWDRLAEARSSLVHGRWYGSPQGLSLAEIVRTVEAGALGAFALLNNAAMDRVDAELAGPR